MEVAQCREWSVGEEFTLPYDNKPGSCKKVAHEPIYCNHHWFVLYTEDSNKFPGVAWEEKMVKINKSNVEGE